MLTSDAPRTLASSAETELLIEEARQRQRRRHKQRAGFLIAAVVLVGLALAITQLTRGGSGVKAAQPPPAVAAAGSDHAVIYEKFQLIWNVPHQTNVRAVIRSWTDPDLRTWRETVLGRPTLEYGERYVRDPLMGPEFADYLYDGHTRALYLTGTGIAPARGTWRQPRPQAFRRRLASMGFRSAGTRVYAGHTVLAFVSSAVRGRDAEHTVLYVDAQSYVPVFWKLSMTAPGRPHMLILERALFWKVLPANSANLRLASLTSLHPGTRIVPERVVPERLAHIAELVYNTEPQHVRGLRATLESPPVGPLYLWPALSIL